MWRIKMTVPVISAPASPVATKTIACRRRSWLLRTHRWPSATPTSGHAAHGNSGNHAVGRRQRHQELGPTPTGRDDERDDDHRGGDAVEDVDAVEVAPVASPAAQRVF